MKDLETAANRFVEAFNNLDTDRFFSCFADDATVFFPFPDSPRRMSGRPNYEKRFLDFFQEVRRERDGPPYLDIDPADMDFQIHGRVAVLTFHLRSEPELNRRTVVFEQRSGQWLIVHLHASVMTRPDTE